VPAGVEAGRVLGFAIKLASNTACSGRVGFCGFSEHFPGFEFFLLLEFFLVPPACRYRLTQTVETVEKGANPS